MKRGEEDDMNKSKISQHRTHSETNHVVNPTLPAIVLNYHIIIFTQVSWTERGTLFYDCCTVLRGTAKKTYKTLKL